MSPSYDAPMSIYSLIAIYFVVWWIVLFAVLPFGVRTQEEEGDIVLGSAHSAPARPLLFKKALATTIVSAIIVFGLWLAVARYGFELEDIADLIFPIR
jgi:predicted secreted protein